MPDFDPNDENDAPQSDEFDLVFIARTSVRVLARPAPRQEDDELIATTILTREMLVQMLATIDGSPTSPSTAQ